MTSKLSVVIPCYNEYDSLTTCVERVLAIASESLEIEVVVVDDASTDGSLDVARRLAEQHREVQAFAHDKNRGKGAALRTGFAKVTGDYACVQDADLEYDPRDLLRLLEPLESGHADVVLGSRFAAGGPHRVLYFWHSVGNKFLTLLSNMFTDLNLTDMETCYKVFRREVIQSIVIEEDRFGFEPEVVAKVAQKGLRIYEMGISYHGRTYEQGKKIGMRDGFRALYCVVRYNARTSPIALQFLVYTLVGGIAALFNLGVFLAAHRLGMPVQFSAPLAFFSAAAVNYLLCVALIFRRGARWQGWVEILVYVGVVSGVAAVDWWVTRQMLTADRAPVLAKVAATGVALVLNFLGRRFLVFPEPAEHDSR